MTNRNDISRAIGESHLYTRNRGGNFPIQPFQLLLGVILFFIGAVLGGHL